MKAIELIKNYLLENFMNEDKAQDLTIEFTSSSSTKSSYILLNRFKIEPSRSIEYDQALIYNIMLIYVQRSCNWQRFNRMNDKLHTLLNNASGNVKEIQGVLSLESKIKCSDNMLCSEYEYRILI